METLLLFVAGQLQNYVEYSGGGETELGWGRDKETSELGPGSDQPRKSAKYLELGQERVM